MNNWIRVGLPIGLGLLAGVMNWITVQSKLKPVAFVSVNRSIPRGEIIRPSDLVRVEASGDTSRLLRAIVPWEERSIAYDTLASRDLLANDLLLLSDTKPHAGLQLGPYEREVTFPLPSTIPLTQIFAGHSVSFHLALGRGSERTGTSQDARNFDDSDHSFRALGPFRVSAVCGDQTASMVGEGSRDREDKHSLSIVVRVDSTGQYGEDVKRLLDAARSDGRERIVAVFVNETTAGQFDRAATTHRTAGL